MAVSRQWDVVIFYPPELTAISPKAITILGLEVLSDVELGIRDAPTEAPDKDALYVLEYPGELIIHHGCIIKLALAL